MKRWMLIVGAVALAGALGYFAGRASAPAKVVERTVTVTAERKDETRSEQREEQRRVVRQVVIERLEPTTGAVVERRREVEHEITGVTAAVEAAAHAETRTATETTRVVERSSTFRLRFEAGWDVRRLDRVAWAPDLYVGAAELRLAGPLWLGAGYGSDKLARLSLAWEF